MSQPVISELSPADADIGTTVNVTITGEGCNFINGASMGVAAPGIQVNSTMVIDENTVVVNITISNELEAGDYMISVQTGEEFPIPLSTLEVTSND